jgi:hypothetical protein
MCLGESVCPGDIYFPNKKEKLRLNDSSNPPKFLLLIIWLYEFHNLKIRGKERLIFR